MRMSEVDVIIVGAGAAGLAAAKTCRENGLSFKVLEAMNRITQVQNISAFHSTSAAPGFTLLIAIPSFRKRKRQAGPCTTMIWRSIISGSASAVHQRWNWMK
jgi:thioredoxin reductase